MSRDHNFQKLSKYSQNTQSASLGFKTWLSKNKFFGKGVLKDFPANVRCIDATEDKWTTFINLFLFLIILLLVKLDIF